MSHKHYAHTDEQLIANLARARRERVHGQEFLQSQGSRIKRLASTAAHQSAVGFQSSIHSQTTPVAYNSRNMSCCTCCLCPEQETVAFIEQCGKFNRVAYPGCNLVCGCCGHASAGVLSLRVQQLDVRCETKTKDNVFVTLVISVQYQVQKENLWDAFYRLTDVRQQLSSYIFDVVRATVPKMNLDDVFVEKEEIAKDIKDELTKCMGSYGYLIIHALVNDIEPAIKVKEAMNEINAARRLRVAALEKAEAEKVSVVKAAEAQAEAKYLEGQGVARQRQAIITGLRDSVKDFDDLDGITPKDVVELMLITQYFDTLREVGGSTRSSTVFLSHAPGSLQDISSQIRNGFMEGAAAARPAEELATRRR